MDVVDPSGSVVASGSLNGHLEISGHLTAGRTVRVHVVVDGIPTVREFVLASPITSRHAEAEDLSVRIGGQVLTLERALKLTDRQPGRDDSVGTGAGDDPGGDRGRPGAGDDHGSGGRHRDDGNEDRGGHGSSGGHDGRGHY
ncbi:hypothetical protein [Deinococcus navajonensis]|uniref:Uncharacterized protein n=1 Tax=Deinococcus navajonensis TaxID=309884 RepID=A0ABV8XQE1_9DEIO